MIILTTVIVSFGIFFVATWSQKSSQKITYTGLEAVKPGEELTDTTSEIDSDGDNLKDWEEVLWRTDPRKADTDLDGTSDGQEVKEGRNPTVKGPKDKISENPFTQNQDGLKNAPPLTITDKFARDVFDQYMTAKQANGGTPLTTDEQRTIVLKMLDASDDVLAKIEYSRTDLNIAKNSSSETIRAYGNELGRIIHTYSITAKDEGIILRDSIKDNDPELVKQLDPIIKSYQNLLSNFLKARIPANAVFIHLTLINSFSDIITTVQGMRNIYTDPIATLQGAGHFPEARASVVNALVRVKAYFKENGVVFTQGEQGYIFNSN